MSELKKILYAEDETDIQTIVETIIQCIGGYEIKICNNGQELLDCVENYLPDLILLDVMMPIMDGPTTFEHLQQSDTTMKIPVIFMTAKAQVQEVQKFTETGALGVITKPFDPMLLCDEIKELWNNKYIKS